METPVCTSCGGRVEPGFVFIAGRLVDSMMHFTPGCEHHPVPKATVVLGSYACIEKYLKENPAYTIQVMAIHGLIMRGGGRC